MGLCMGLSLLFIEYPDVCLSLWLAFCLAFWLAIWCAYCLAFWEALCVGFSRTGHSELRTEQSGQVSSSVVLNRFEAALSAFRNRWRGSTKRTPINMHRLPEDPKHQYQYSPRFLPTMFEGGSSLVISSLVFGLKKLFAPRTPEDYERVEWRCVRPHVYPTMENTAYFYSPAIHHSGQTFQLMVPAHSMP